MTNKTRYGLPSFLVCPQLYSKLQYIHPYIFTFLSTNFHQVSLKFPRPLPRTFIVKQNFFTMTSGSCQEWRAGHSSELHPESPHAAARDCSHRVEPGHGKPTGNSNVYPDVSGVYRTQERLESSYSSLGPCKSQEQIPRSMPLPSNSISSQGMHDFQISSSCCTPQGFRQIRHPVVRFQRHHALHGNRAVADALTWRGPFDLEHMCSCAYLCMYCIYIYTYCVIYIYIIKLYIKC